MSSVFRDLIEGECAEPNAIGNFVNQFTSDRSGMYHHGWEREQHQHQHQHNRFPQDHLDDEQRHFDDIFEQANYDDNDFDAMLDRNNMRMPPGHIHENQMELHLGSSTTPSTLTGELKHFFKDFLLSSQAHHLMPPIPLQGDVRLTNGDKMKIRNRSEVLIRHMNEGQDKSYENDQLGRLFDALGIEHQESFDDFDTAWGNDNINNMDNGLARDSIGNHQWQDETFAHGVPDYLDREEDDDQQEDYEDEDYEQAWDRAHLEDEEEDFDDYDNQWNEDKDDFNPFESAWRAGEDHSVEAAWDEVARKTFDDPRLRRNNLMSRYNTGESEQRWVEDYDQFQGTVSDERLQEYQFVIDHARDEDTFESGMNLFDKGLIADAIISLESEVMRNPTNSEAWMYLGMAHAENDKDQQAITCLLKSINLDPTSLQARMALSVSYTNDFQRERALETLVEWLKNNPSYRHMNVNMPEADENEFMDTWTRHRHVSELFLEAARMRPNNSDHDVQTALGLLYNMSYEYDKAVDCFKAALQNNPSDYQLWNKLGATLANSNRSQEALGAYFQALEQKPSYVRARSNLGISYLALNMYTEAAQTFLGALSIHPEAVHIWDNLKMVFRLMERNDLVDKADNRDVNDFVQDFKFM
ncbi:hypothetical protein SAMD00019534_074840 [Acytostelium subglobosum LB1]|uniref:hypothetical protein n=1 Tax=Acytostelium subglobosum LB1 TaxID=1410327 RepID=UPI0006448235|nr:hypothetical protein SAMD00019534_074840 [Acytostelium subglobosum LB1]GAM24309.1 hypothetical protein SAMD00019534_074840 [Acytostelium subglobosum LB1]|eukprot:XP_012752635.1 hypothetical protein SAMD00019534_074840 [Acytostelium subglobosum LB1]